MENDYLDKLRKTLESVGKITRISIPEAPKIDVASLERPSLADVVWDETGFREAQEEIAQRFEEEQRYRTAVLDALVGIQNNTAALTSVVELLQASKGQQDAIYDLLTEILAIAKAESVEEAKSLYRRVMEKISQGLEDADTIAKLSTVASWLLTAYKAFKAP